MRTIDRKRPSKTKRRSPIDEFLALPDEEKERIWESYNREIPLSETRPLTPAERQWWENAKRGGPKRSQAADGAKSISVRIDRSLLDRADAYARRAGITRAALVARGLKLAIARNGNTARR